MDYLYVIDKKTKEHQFEIEGCLLELDKFAQSTDDKKNLESLKKIMILKDKIMFHKGAIMVLDDLKKELTDVKPKTL